MQNLQKLPKPYTLLNHVGMSTMPLSQHFIIFCVSTFHDYFYDIHTTHMSQLRLETSYNLFPLHIVIILLYELQPRC